MSEEDPSASGLDRILRGVAIVSFFLIVTALCFFRVQSLDFGWHLKTGEMIWATHSIPTHDVFSFVVEGHRWVDSHWLFQLVLYGVHLAAGIPGVTALRVGLILATFAVLLSTTYRKEYLPVSIVVCLLAALSSHHRYLIRPELASFLFLAAFFYFSERVQERPRLYWVAIFAFQVLWANMHGLHAVGIALVAGYFAGDAIQFFVSRAFPRIFPIEMSARDLKLKGGLVAAVIVASLMNANGFDGIVYPYKIFSELRGEISYFPNLQELLPTFSIETANWPLLNPVNVYKMLLAVSLLSWLGQRRRVRFAHVLVYLMFLYLSTLAFRNIALFAIVATPITIQNLNAMLDSWTRKRSAVVPQRAIALATAFTAIVLAVGTWSAGASDRLFPRLGVGHVFGVGEDDHFPSELIADLKTIDGNLFNTPYFGGYLIWKLYPPKQIALDGRWEVYREALPELLRAFRDPEVFSELAKEHDIQAIVLDRFRTSHSRKMFKWLRVNEEWRLTRNTPSSFLFERVQP